MRVTVTVGQALAELAMKRLVMRQAMAILATGRGGVWPLVAVNTVYPAVIRDCLREIPGFLNVTNLAEFRRHPTGRHDLKWLVGRMTAETIRIRLQ